MTKEKWLKERRKGIGGTDIGAILGINPYQTPLSVYLSKVEGKEIEENEYLRAGRLLEEPIAQMFQEETGYTIFKPKKAIYISEEEPIFRASIDRLYKTFDNVHNILDCKNTRLDIDEVVPYHFVQVQWYLGIYGGEAGTVAYLCGGYKLKYFEFSRDDNLISMLQDQAREFWNKYILTKTPPPATNQEDLKHLFPKALPNTFITADDSLLDKVKDLQRIKITIKDLEKQAGQLEFTIKEYLQDKEAIRYEDKEILTYKTQETKRFDSSSFTKANPLLAEDYYKVSTSRVLRLKVGENERVY